MNQIELQDYTTKISFSGLHPKNVHQAFEMYEMIIEDYIHRQSKLIEKEIEDYLNRTLEWQIVKNVGLPQNLDGRSFLIEYFDSYNCSDVTKTAYYVAGCDNNGFFWLEDDCYGEYFEDGQVYAWKEIR